MNNFFKVPIYYRSFKDVAVALTEILTVIFSTLSPAIASGYAYAVDYTKEIDLLSSYNRPITQSLLPKYVTNVEYYPDDAIFPCSPAGVTLKPTRHPPRKCHYLAALVGKDMPTLIFVLDGQRITAIIQEDHLDEGGEKLRNVRRLLQAWDSTDPNVPMVNGPNRDLYLKDHMDNSNTAVVTPASNQNDNQRKIKKAASSGQPNCDPRHYPDGIAGIPAGCSGHIDLSPRSQQQQGQITPTQQSQPARVDPVDEIIKRGLGNLIQGFGK